MTANAEAADTPETSDGKSRGQQLMVDVASALTNLTDEGLDGQVWEHLERSKRDRAAS